MLTDTTRDIVKKSCCTQAGLTKVTKKGCTMAQIGHLG